MQNDERRIAVFIDFENVAMGVRESNYGNFDIELVLKRLVEKGKIMVKRAYSDWHRYSEFKRAFHQSAIELIDVPQTRYSGKNSADIRIVVDALDLSHQKDHIDTFVLVSGDSDFSPLVSKLRENGRYVIGMGVKQSSSDLLVNNCDEFIYYEDLVRPTTAAPGLDPKLRNLPHKKAEALRLVLETFEALQREGKESIYGSMIKQTLVRKLPSFNESYFGYPTFSRLLEDAAENKLLKLTKDQKSGGYIVTSIADVSAQSVASTSAFGEASQETAAAEETISADSSAVMGSADARDYYRRSRWGRGRWSRGPQRISNFPGARQFPAQRDSSLAEVPPTAPATTEPQEAGISVPPAEEVASPVTEQETANREASQPVAQSTAEAGPSPLAEVHSQAELPQTHRHSHRHGRRDSGSQRSSHPAEKVQKLSTPSAPIDSVANPDSSIVSEDREAKLNTSVQSHPEDQRFGGEASPPRQGSADEITFKSNHRPGSRRAGKGKGRSSKTAARKPRKKNS